MLFVKNIPITQPPWRIQDPHRGTVVDQNDRLLARIPKAGEIPFDERNANLKLIEKAPELLAALVEAAYILDVKGVPLEQPFYDLINECRAGAVQIRPRNR